MARETILLVEDDVDIAEMIRFHAEGNGFAVVHDQTGSDSARFVGAMEPAVVLLDLGLPDHDGVDICAQIRSSSRVPIIMVTARDAERDVVRGLQVGADDYVTKPFSPRELFARIEALLRRTGRQSIDTDRIVVAHHVFDLGRRSVALPDESIVRPTAREFDLAWYLAKNAGLVLSRSQILDEVWGFDYRGESRTVDVHVRQLRRKFPKLRIATEWGVGYRMLPE